MFAFRSETKVSVLLQGFRHRSQRSLGFTIMNETGNYSQQLQATSCYLLHLRLNYYYYFCLHPNRVLLNSFPQVLSFCFGIGLLLSLLHSLLASVMDHLNAIISNLSKNTTPVNDDPSYVSLKFFFILNDDAMNFILEWDKNNKPIHVY